jgi:hypothetical protein
MKSPVALAAVIILAQICQADTLRNYNCPKVCQPPILDGRLDDPAWSVAAAVSLVDTMNGGPVDRLTVARMCWDDENLYVAFRCSSPDIKGSVTDHDGPIYLEDAAELFVDPDGDLKSYTELDLSPGNVAFDADFRPDIGQGLGSESSTAWTCAGYRSATAIDGTLNDSSDRDRCWTAEMAIPFQAIGEKTPVPGQTWRANLYRSYMRPRPSELQAWSPTYTSGLAFHVPKRFGIITFVDTNRQAQLAKTQSRS